MREERPAATIAWALAGLLIGVGVPTLIALACGWLKPLYQ